MDLGIMSQIEQQIECTACGAPVQESCADPKEPCPYCGCQRKLLRFRFTEVLDVKQSFKFKAVNVKKRKKVYWLRGGDDYQWCTGRWLHLQRTFDKENDIYTEILIDKKTGEIVRKVVEPLSAHTQHGAARKK